MWSVAGFLCPRLLDDTHPLRLTESFLLLVKSDKQYEKGMMCGVFLVDTFHSVIANIWCVWAARFVS